MAMDNGIMPVMNMGNDDNQWWWIIILFALLGYGNNAQAVTPTQLQAGFDTSSIQNKLDSIGSGLADGFYAQNTNTLTGFSSAQNTMAQGFAGLNTAIVENGYQTRGQLSELGFQMKDCCCTTNRNIDAVRFENAQNTCAITTAIHEEGEATRALITQTEIQSLRDQLAEAKSIIANSVQTANIVSQLKTQ